MNDDKLRSILHHEADQIEEGSDSWSRLESRWTTAPIRSASRSFAFGGLAIVVVMALVVGLVWIGRDDRHRRIAARALSRSMPRQIVAVTNRYHLVILDARTGKVIRTLARDVATFRGTPEIAASPDGSQIYFTAIDDPTPGCATSGIETVFRVPRHGGTPVVVGRGRTVAVNGDAVAFSRDYENCAASGPGALEIRGGPAARVRTEPPPDPRANELALFNLSWSGDGAVFAFDWSREGVRDGVGKPYVLDAGTAATVGAARCLCRVAKGLESFGFLGRSQNLLAATPTGGGRQYAERAVVLRESGSVLGTLFRWQAAIDGLESDARGRHFVLVSPTKRMASKTYIDVLYRWSKGETKPTKIRDGIIAATWIPDDPLVIPHSVIASSVDSRNVRVGDGVRFRIPTGDTRIGVRTVPGQLTFERKTTTGWQAVRTVEPASTAYASRPDALIQTVTIPSVARGRYRLCASVDIRRSGARRVGKTCRSMVVRP